MSSYAFAAMLLSFVVVLGWYALNHERDRDGQDGVLGLRTADDAEGEDGRGRDRAPGHALRAARGRRPAEPPTSPPAETSTSQPAERAGRAQSLRPVDRVRKKAEAMRKAKLDRR